MFLTILIIIIIFSLYYFLIKFNKEHFNNTLSNFGSKPYDTQKKVYTSAINTTFNGRMATDDQYFYDKLFDDVTYYPNEYQNDYNLNDVLTTGWEKCKQECPGNCVEYYVSGNAYCFPY